MMLARVIALYAQTSFDATSFGTVVVAWATIDKITNNSEWPPCCWVAEPFAAVCDECRRGRVSSLADLVECRSV
jgi:hypothetical protein